MEFFLKVKVDIITAYLDMWTPCYSFMKLKVMQASWSGSYWLRTRFLSSGTYNIWDQISPWGISFLMHCRTCSSILGLFPWDCPNHPYPSCDTWGQCDLLEQKRLCLTSNLGIWGINRTSLIPKYLPIKS